MNRSRLSRSRSKSPKLFEQILEGRPGPHQSNGCPSSSDPYYKNTQFGNKPPVFRLRTRLPKVVETVEESPESSGDLRPGFGMERKSPKRTGMFAFAYKNGANDTSADPLNTTRQSVIKTEPGTRPLTFKKGEPITVKSEPVPVTNRPDTSKPATSASNATAMNTQQKGRVLGIKAEILDDWSSDTSLTETQSKAANGNGNGSSVSASTNNNNGRFPSQTRKRSPLRTKPKPSATQTSQSQGNKGVVNLSEGEDEDTETEDSTNASQETIPALDKSIGEAERLNSSFAKTEEGLNTTVSGKSRESNQGESDTEENIVIPDSPPRRTNLMTPLQAYESRLTRKRKASEPGTATGLPLTKQRVTERSASSAEPRPTSDKQSANDLKEKLFERNSRYVCVEGYLTWLFERYKRHYAAGDVSGNMIPLLQKVLRQPEVHYRLQEKIKQIRRNTFLMETRTTNKIFLTISETIKQILEMDMEDVVGVYTATINLLTTAKRVV